MAGEEACSRGSEALRQMVVGEQGDGAAPAPALRAALADATAGGDLGFTAGGWTVRSGTGEQSQGSYATLWKRTARCDWQEVRTARIEHGVPVRTAPPLDVDRLALPEREAPPHGLDGVDAVERAMREFASTLGGEGLAAALRTYGRNNDHMLYVDGHEPFAGMDAANTFLVAHPLHAQSKETARDLSADSSMAFSWGEFAVEKSNVPGYLQVWQYDPKVANWGLRLLMLSRTGTR